MKQYLLAVHMLEGAEAPPAEAMEQAYRDVDELNRELMERNAWVFAGGLDPAGSTTVVRAVDGEVLLTDGPFAEAK